MKMKNIAIFASGEGTNAQQLIDYFKDNKTIKVALVVSNKSIANVLNRAKVSGIPSLIINKKDFYDNNNIIEKLLDYNIDIIIHYI